VFNLMYHFMFVFYVLSFHLSTIMFVLGQLPVLVLVVIPAYWYTCMCMFLYCLYTR